MPDVSIMISAKDNFSGAILKMRQATQGFNKDADGLQKKLDALNRTKTTIQTDITKAKGDLQTAAQAFKRTGDEASRAALVANQTNYNNLKSSLKAVTNEANATEKSLLNLTKTAERVPEGGGNGDGGGGGLGGLPMGAKGTFKAIGAAWAIQALGEAGVGMANTLVPSAFGRDAGDMFSNVLGTAATGAAAGMMIAPGIGAAIGGALGAGIGAIQGATAIFENKEDYYKGNVESDYQGALQEREANRMQGSAIAAQRESDLIKFETMMGDPNKAREFTTDMRQFAAKTPLRYNDLSYASSTMMQYGVSDGDVMERMQQLGDVALGDSEKFKHLSLAYSQTAAAGKLMGQDLNQMIQSGFNPLFFISEKTGKSIGELKQDMADGKVTIDDVNDALRTATQEGGKFFGAMEKQSTTFTGMQSTLQDSQDSMMAAQGEGYNDERMKGMQAELDFMNGAGGAKMQEGYRMIGQWQASLENEKERYIREAMDAAMNSDEYLSAIDTNNGAEAGRILAEAKVNGEREYMTGPGAQEMIATNQALLEGIQTTNAQNWNAGGYALAEQMTTGMMNAFGKLEGTVIPGPVIEIGMKLPGAGASVFGAIVGDYLTDNADKINGDGSGGAAGEPKAVGMERVPYDNYPAMLHEGERVLTASKVRELDRNTGGGKVEININNPSVRNDGDLDAIGKMLRDAVAKARMLC